MNSKKTARLTTAGIMIALAFILSYVESLLPSFTAVPGVKIGLANIVTMVALYTLGWKYAAAISLVRVILTGITFSGMSAMMYGLAGAALSLVTIILLKSVRIKPRSNTSDVSKAAHAFSTPAVSIAGGVAHNIGQILVAWAVLGSAVLYYLPVLLVTGLVAGLITGIITYYVLLLVPRSSY